MLHGRYEILERLGAGGMARVYKARDTRLGRIVAVKKIHEDLADQDQLITRFQREAQVIAQLHHPHIVELHDIVELEAGGMAMIMEYVEGMDLAGAIKPGAPLDPDLAVALLRPIADALEAAHAADIIHRDIKPANILIGVDGRLKLSDFGIAKMLEETQLTRTGGFLGTPAYIAPEQARGELVGPTCDQYALATVLYELVTGRPPFTGPNALALLHNILKGQYTDPRRLNPRVSEALAEIIARGMAADPADRYPSVTAFGEALGHLIGPLDPSAHRKVIALMCEGHEAAAEALAGVISEGRPVPPPKAEPRPSGRQSEVLTAPGEDSLSLPPSRRPRWIWLAAAIPALAGAGLLAAQLGGEPTGEDEGAAPIMATVQPSAPVEAVPITPDAALAATPTADLGAADLGAPDQGPAQAEPDMGAQAHSASAQRTRRRAPSRRAAARRPAQPSTPVNAPPVNAPNAAPTPAAPKPAAQGTLALFTSPWANVYIDGEHRGRTPYLKTIPLDSGRHTLELRNPGKGAHTERIRIKSGATLTRRIRLPDL